MWTTGTVVFDKAVGQMGSIRHVESVPATRDLFGTLIPAHIRYTVSYEDRGVCTGEWSNDRRETDLVPTVGTQASLALVVAA